MGAPSIKESTEVVPLLIRFYRSEADKASHKNLKHVPLHPTDAEGKSFSSTSQKYVLHKVSRNDRITLLFHYRVPLATRSNSPE